MNKTQKFSNMIQLNAESLGIKSLDNEIVDYLNVELEEKMRLILRAAQKFIRISKRKTLKVDDLGHALKLYNLDHLLGYDSYSMVEYEKIENVKGLWRMKQNVIDIEEYLSKPMAIYPMQPFPHFYWFAIDGKRPNIPENFIRNNTNIQDKEKDKEDEKDGERNRVMRKTTGDYFLGLDNSPDNMAKDINKENKINNNNNDNNYNLRENNGMIINNINNNENDLINDYNNNANVNIINTNDSSTNNSSKDDIKKISHVIHNISKELQIFFENFKQRFTNEVNNNKLNSSNPYLILSKEMQISIDIIKGNPGVVELVPYIINFLMTSFESDPSNIKLSHCILHYINSIVLNKHFNIEPYLHQILALLLSFILFDNDNSSNNNNIIINNSNTIFLLDPLIRLKFFAIKVLKQIIDKNKIKYHNLEFQLANVFSDNLNLNLNNKNNKEGKTIKYMTVFGAIEGMKMIGPILTAKSFENKKWIRKNNDNNKIDENLEKFLKECEGDEEICNAINSLNIKNDFNEDNIEVTNQKPKISNIDNFCIGDIKKKKKIFLYFLIFFFLRNKI